MSIEQNLLFSPHHTRLTAEERVRLNGVPILRKSSIANHYALTVFHTHNRIAHYLVQQRPSTCAVVSESGETYREFKNADEMINELALRQYPPSQPSQSIRNQDPE
jgi:hypothetical protein